MASSAPAIERFLTRKRLPFDPLVVSPTRSWS
jgi:hypothetical protein